MSKQLSYRMLRLPLALQIFSLLPVGAVVYRLSQWGVSAPATAFEAAILDTPFAFMLHIFGAALFSVLAPFQFSKSLRSYAPRLHRRIGYGGWLGGMIMVLSGAWLVLAYPINEGSILATQILRLVFAGLTAYWLVAGLVSARQRRFKAHRGHMLRSYAMAASTTSNALIFGIWVALGQDLDAVAFTWLMGIGWVLAVLVAEIIHRRPARTAPTPLPA